MANNKIILFALVTVIGAMAVFLLVAAILGISIKEAQQVTMTFLADWGGIAPAKLHELVALTIGGSASFALLVGLALALDALADASIHYLSALFHHFGIKEVIWSERHSADWKAYRNQLRIQWGAANPDDNIAKDPQKWATFKNQRGKNAVRASRTLTYFSVLIILAGIIDLFSSTFFNRGVALFIIGIVALVGFCYVWADRKASYVNEIILANDSLHAGKDAHGMNLSTRPEPALWKAD